MERNKAQDFGTSSSCNGREICKIQYTDESLSGMPGSIVVKRAYK